MAKKTLGLDAATWRELLAVAGLSLAVAFVAFFWDLSKNGRDLVVYAQKALAQKNYVTVTLDASGFKAHGVAADGTYDIQANTASPGDAAKTILAAVNGSGLGPFRFIGSAGGQVVGTNQTTPTPPAPGAAPDPAKPLTFFGPPADPGNTLAITQQGTKTVGKDSFLRYEIVPGRPVSSIVLRAADTYVKGFSRKADRVFIYINSKTKLPGYMLQTGPSGPVLTIWRFETAGTVGEAWGKFQEAGAQKLAFFGLDPTEAAQILSER